MTRRLKQKWLFYLFTGIAVLLLMVSYSTFGPDQFTSESGTPGGLLHAGFFTKNVTPHPSREDTLHIHFISASEEYKSEQTLKELKEKLEQSDNKVKVTASWGQDAGSVLPDIELLEQADLMLVFARRMTLPEDQLGYINRHIEAEKPVIGIRTASHAFQDFLELDALVFGGDYDGHGDDEPVDVTLAEGALDHPILEGVSEWRRPGKIYHNPELGTNTQVLLFGEGLESGIYEPLAWTHRYGENGRAFYTSMGLPADFENDHFLTMLFNAIHWTSGYALANLGKTEIFVPGSYQYMDYGPVLTESIQMGWPEDGLVRKGLAIRLDHDAAMIFDTDLVRFATGTLGGWLDISQTDHTSYKGSQIAGLEGRQVFATSEIAGWARYGSFYGPREDGLGNLPHDWAHYKGYYRHGDQVVLSYTVGETGVLELPESVKHGETVGFVRTLRLDASPDPMKTLIAEKRNSWTVYRMTDREIIFETEEGAFAVLLAHGPEEAKLKQNQERIELHLPKSEESRMARVLVFEMDAPEDPLAGEFRQVLETLGLPDLEGMTRGGPLRWDEQIRVTGNLAENESGYVIDRIPLPFDNPWGAWMRLSGLDFFEDGSRAAVSTWNGDVWIVSGLDESLEQVTWHRYASGLFYPMGVAIVDGQIYVTERSQLTRLHDLNGNGEADYYENFNNDGIVYPMAHSLELQVDSDGYFYFFKNGNRVPGEVPQHGALMRVSPDGSTREVYARGYRGANSLGIGPDDMIVGADQEGNWVPVDRIDILERGGFYGDRRHGGENLAVGDFEPPVAWTPKVVNNSSGLITYAGDPRWGPLAGQWVLGSYGQRSLFAILMEEKGGRFQGGIIRLPVESTSGLMRGRVNPADGQLYMVGLRGWQTLATEDGSFERIRYAGGNANLPKGIQVTPAGVRITFTDPLDPTDAKNIGNYRVERWDYIYSSRYGSPDVLPDDPDTEGRESVEVTSVSVSLDRKEIFLELAVMRSVMQMKIAYELTFAGGQSTENAIYHTVNWLSEAEAGDRPQWQQRMMERAQAPDEDIALQQESETSAEEDDYPEWYQEGANLFQRNCAACHVSGGVAPAMEDSQWASGPHESLVRILLHGKRGSRGVMTPFSWLDDEEVAAIVNYIRLHWHEKEPITPSQVEQIRNMTEGRIDLWTEEELRSFLQ